VRLREINLAISDKMLGLEQLYAQKIQEKERQIEQEGSVKAKEH
jgi:hypothetical protein